MSQSQSKSPATWPAPADDIQSLRGHLKNLPFAYVDISVMRRHQDTMQRWSLLRELNQIGRQPGRTDAPADPTDHDEVES